MSYAREMRAVAGIALLVASCTPQAGAVIDAPLVTATTARQGARDSAPALPRAGPVACSEPWAPDGPTERVVVVCSGDVRREAFDEAGQIARAVAPALEPARARICACASRVTPPPHVDLSIRAAPDEGSSSVEIADPEEDLDPTVGPEFAACVGTVVVTFAPFHLDACPAGGNAILVYPVRVDLGS
jgi:hypothetical protein